MAEPNIYTVGGTVQANEGGIYLPRKADTDLLELCRSGTFTYLLTPRQMGKSSLMIRASEQLIEEGIQSVIIDLTQIGTQVTAEQWYKGLLTLIADQLMLNTQVDPWWHKHSYLGVTQRLTGFFEKVLLPEVPGQVVVFVDEIDTTLSLDFTDDFFAAIRYLYSARAINPLFQRISFTLIGVATPSDLIQDPQRTPFNIGQGIDLQSFQLSEVQPLEEGLEGKTSHPHEMLKAILFWTGGQPFLTQKVCKLVSISPLSITSRNETQVIEKIVQSKIIENWEDQDDLFHFRTIQDRLRLNDKELTRPMLRLYEQIIYQEGVVVNNSTEQIKLRLTGWVVQRDGKLQVHNLIYKKIFNQDWLERSLPLSKLCYFSEDMDAWKASKFKDKSRLLSGKALAEALNWSEDKSLRLVEKKFLRASQDAKKYRTLRNITLIASSVLIGAISSGYWVYDRYASCPMQKGVVGEKIGDLCFRTVITSGEKIVFLSSANYYLTKGINLFKEGNHEGNYGKAVKLFEQAIEGDPTDPVPQIFFNNAKARREGNSLKIAVVVSIDYYEDAAKEVLRGIADAQEEFNSTGGKNGRLLEIVIANDGNEIPVAEKVAKDLSAKGEILGIIGHHASEGTRAALSIYEKSQIAVISPTSSSSRLEKKFFFRAISSTKIAARKYAEYIKNNLKLHKNEIAIFYNPDSEYSKTLTEEIANNKNLNLSLKKTNSNITNIADIQSSIKEKIQQIVRNGVKMGLLIPNIETNSVSIAIARINANLPKDRIRLLSAMSLSENGTLEKGKKAVEGMTLFSPCIDRNSRYIKKATVRWQQEIYWRVATSYDATKAFIKAISLSKQPNRREILKNLESLKLSVNESSGFGLDWSDPRDYHSNTKRKYCLNQIKDGVFVKIPKN